MRTFRISHFINVVFALFIGCGPIIAQTATSPSSDELAQARAALVTATQEYKSRTEELLRLEEEETRRAAATLEQLRQLYAEGVIAKSELAEGEQTLAATQTRLAEARQQIADADHMLAEIEAAEELAKSTPAPSPQPEQTQSRQQGSYSATATMIRYTGQTSWSVVSLAGVQTFFSAKFGRMLPVSALGQTATHNRLGFDHRSAVDVALHPDSAEGRALINYLQSKGIPFLAFRSAVPGAATGPHIHIGRPSNRIA